MTKVVFYKRHGVFYGFEERDHAGYAEFGEDIVCSAITAMTMLIVNTCETAWGIDVDYKIDEDAANIRVVIKEALPEFASSNEKQYAVSGLIKGYYYQLMDLIEDYSDFIDVDVEEKPIR
ncbi:MAG: ribosomal-processing cysteine protease Prp [Clostridia bacterium]|nr:ribosomal-processing cysteine protease Prp [Clostridia bacterium]